MSRSFTPSNQNTHERLSTTTVGLVALSDFRKRRAEVLEQQEREAREALKASTPDRSQTGTPANASDASDSERQLKKKKRKDKGKAAKSKLGGNKLSFAGDDEDDDGAEDGGHDVGMGRAATRTRSAEPQSRPPGDGASAEEGDAAGVAGGEGKEKDVTDATTPPLPKSASPPARGGSAGPTSAETKAKVALNASVGIVPRALTKAALRREAAEREALRKEFLELQAAVKATDIAVPFVFYDGANTPGGVVTVKKGDFIWVFLDRSRRVGATLGVATGPGGAAKRPNARRDWARVGVDDLMLVRGTIIIPHHYEFYFFIVNKTMGPGNRRLFDYSSEAPPAAGKAADGPGAAPAPVMRRAAEAPAIDIESLEGAKDDPNLTKVVDRRWYERNKHIYPASVWQVFEPEKDYRHEVKRDPGGNTFFYSR